MKSKKIKTLTNQITYNRILRAITKILKENVFEFNDSYTRNVIKQKVRTILVRASALAIKDFILIVKDFDTARPNYMEVQVFLVFHNMIEQVELNISNSN